LMVGCGGKPVPPTTPSNQGGDAVELAWRATQAADESVDVTLVVAGTPHALGQLSAASDDAPGTPKTCTIAKSTETMSEFTCGMTPAYNMYFAELAGSELIVTRVSGVDNEIDPEAQEERLEVKRIPVNGTKLTTTPYSP
jgi:hypothetical protein